MREREKARKAEPQTPRLVEVDDNTIMRHLDMPFPGSFAIRLGPGRMVFTATRVPEDPILH